MTSLIDFQRAAAEQLTREDPLLCDMLEREHDRQGETLALVASMSAAPPSVLACAGSVLTNVTTEGYPGARYHAGCAVVDEIETLAMARATAAFDAEYANVQPHSGSSANLAVLFALMAPGDVLMGMDLDAGGHLTHGSSASITGRAFRAVHYGVGPDGVLNYADVARLAREHRPRVIVCGASSYPRTLDFARFREIADEVGAWLVADISHIAGLVVAGEHPSPVPFAHVVTTSTYKQLCGPRGGLILSGPDAHRPGPDGRTSLAETLQRAVFPRTQGTPDLASVAAKARALGAVHSPAFRAFATRIRAAAQVLAMGLTGRGHTLTTGGTDNHLVVIDVGAKGYSGAVVESALEECGIVVNRNRIPGDTRSARITSGIRLGTNGLALRGFDAAATERCAELFSQVVAGTEMHDDVRFTLDADVRDRTRAEVAQLCRGFPLPGHTS